MFVLNGNYKPIPQDETFATRLKQDRFRQDPFFRKSEQKRKHLRKIQKAKRQANR